MRLLPPIQWLHAPADREIIGRWTVHPGAEHALSLPQPADPDRFEFLVLGDTGDSEGSGARLSPQDAVARELAADACLPVGEGRACLVLHVGDVVYMTGAARLYERNFRLPYAPFLTPESTAGRLVFRLPFLPVPGNHDYYDPGRWARLISGVPGLGGSLRRLSRRFFAYSLPLEGSDRGRTFMEAFVAGEGDAEAPLPYVPGERTRLPNRYYRFRLGSVEFFALDSNTLAAPPPSADPERVRSEAARRVAALEARARALSHEVRRDEAALRRRTAGRSGPPPPELEARLGRLSLTAMSVQQELAEARRRARYLPEDYDAEQLRWLDTALRDSVRERPQGWRVVYLHHPLYTSVTNHCEHPDVLGVRQNLLALLHGRAHLVLSGHAHAFEWLRSDPLPHAGLFVTGGGGQPSLWGSVLDPHRRRRFHGRCEALLRAGVTEVAYAGRGPSAAGGFDGTLYHYLRVEVGPDSLLVRPVGVRRTRGAYRREEPLPVFHSRKSEGALPDRYPRLLEGVEVFRDGPPRPRWR